MNTPMIPADLVKSLMLLNAKPYWLYHKVDDGDWDILQSVLPITIPLVIDSRTPFKEGLCFAVNGHFYQLKAVKDDIRDRFNLILIKHHKHIEYLNKNGLQRQEVLPESSEMIIDLLYNGYISGVLGNTIILRENNLIKRRKPMLLVNLPN